MLPDDATVAEEHLLTFSTRCPDVRTLHFCVDRCATAPRVARRQRISGKAGDARDDEAEDRQPEPARDYTK